MSKLLTLISLNFRAMLSTINLGKNKKTRMSGIGALLFLMAISLYISGVYSFTFGEMLAQVGLLDFLIPLIAIIGFLMTVIMTLAAASGYVFSNKDSDLVLALPVSAFSVMLSKILALYLECLIIGALFVLPSGAAYIYYGGAWDAGFIIRLIISALFMPVLATMFGVILGWLLSWISAHSNHKSLVSTVLMLVFFGAILVFSFRIGNLGNLLLQNKESFMHALATWMLPFGLMQQGILSSWLSLLYFCLICLVPFLAVVWLFSKGYKKILSGLAANKVRSDYKLRDVKTNSKFSALYKKELRRYFGTSIYFTNTAVGALILIGLSIYALISKAKVAVYITQLGGIDACLPIALIIICAILAMVDTTCVSISLEGKTLWILKEAPVPAATLFSSKIAVNLLVGWSTTLISVALLTVGFGIPVVPALTILLTGFAMVLCVATYGLWINLLFPKMDADNDTVVVKQSLSAMLGYFGGWLPCLIGFFVYNALKNSVSFPVFCLLCTAFLLLVSAVIWHRLRTWGADRLVEL